MIIIDKVTLEQGDFELSAVDFRLEKG